MKIKNRILNIAIALDQLLWTLITLGNGSPDETMSAAAWRIEKEGRLAGKIFRPIIDMVFFFDDNHCKTSYESEVLRTQLHASYRTKL